MKLLLELFGQEQNQEDKTASVQLLKIYDREAQALFDNNFNILNGPDAPDLTVRELDQELIINTF